ANCYEPGEAVRTEEQTFTVPERGEIFAFSFASLCIQCLPEIEGSLHRVNPDGMLGESLSMVTLDQFIGGSEEPEWIFFQLVEPVMVEAGERFAIRATARSILTSPSDAFDGGELLSDPSRDLTFRVYSIPEPSSTYLILLGGLAISGSRKRTSD
ncbi:MAG: PEP-CTERM sorting domain-containing protein, partial [Akkermansiaceae bacterium]